MVELWVHRERRTARLIRTLYDEHLRKKSRPSSEVLYSLARLTWITKGGGNDDTDNTAAVVAPALSSILRLELTATSPSELVRELDEAEVPEGVVRLAARPIGIVNYYTGFRNIAKVWVDDHRDEVWDIMRTVAGATDDNVVRGAYEAIERLPLLPRPGAGDGQPSNLLTPLLACLDPRHRAPIINGRKKWLLGKLRLGASTLADQHDGLVRLIGQAGIDDAFALDVADEAEIERAMKNFVWRVRAKPTPKALAARDDEDVKYLQNTDPVAVRRLHNSMTNALRACCATIGLNVEEGSDQACMFDALIREYQGTERHLLVEVKTDDAPASYRLAVGQLLDYRRLHPDRAAIDLAVLFPAKPKASALEFLGFVGVKVMWFNSAMKQLAGQVQLRRR